MRILVDTNVILDVLLKREPFFESSYGALKQALENEAVCFVSASAITDIFYLLRKGLGDAGRAREGIERLLRLISVADIQPEDIQTALSDAMPDFEDAVVHSVADRYKVDYILTRNTKDFAGQTVPAITPKSFLEL